LIGGSSVARIHFEIDGLSPYNSVRVEKLLTVLARDHAESHRIRTRTHRNSAAPKGAEDLSVFGPMFGCPSIAT
jgi:hypothetical protein